MHEVQIKYNLKIRIEMPTDATINDLAASDKKIREYLSSVPGATLDELEFIDWRIYLD